MQPYSYVFTQSNDFGLWKMLNIILRKCLVWINLKFSRLTRTKTKLINLTEELIFINNQVYKLIYWVKNSNSLNKLRVFIKKYSNPIGLPNRVIILSTVIFKMDVVIQSVWLVNLNTYLKVNTFQNIVFDGFWWPF